jgi:prepilin-type N-terminal cleavage/methylation domain-containing protein
MSDRGFSLVEAVVAVAILGLAVTAVLPAFLTQLDANTRSGLRSVAAGIAAERLEALRSADPTGLPTGGAPETQAVAVDGRGYELRTTYCGEPLYCPPTSPGARHIRVEVWLDGRRLFDAETVFTELR